MAEHRETFVTNDQDSQVECLCMTFPSDQARPVNFLEKLKESDFHRIEGFPIGEDHHILVLSYPPYFTA